jgi:hypothetical protein
LSWDAGVLIVGVLSILAFCAAFHFSGLVARAQAAIATARQTVAVISDKTLDDEQKERAVQGGALRMFGQFALITITAILVLAAPAVVMWIAEMLGAASFAAVSDFLLSWEVIIGATVLIMAAIWLVRRF